MEKEQELEWAEAQKIVLSCSDLVDAARRQLKFLAAVDKRRSLYEDGPVLRRAIYRYKSCWLPLLDKYGDSNSIIGCPLVVPLDCEWIWHCHRLNPVQYKKDCEEFYGKILNSQNVESTTTATPAHPMVELWGKLHPEEPFELNCNSVEISEFPVPSKNFNYDLVDAVKRQSSFCYQVSRPTMHDGRYLEAAVARYKGFLHLIKRNQENSLKRFSVPTYDVDIIWHSHQLQPVPYHNDMLRLLGKVLGHDDTDSDRSNGSKLDVGFSETTTQWEASFGLRYWRAGAMYRGNPPFPLGVTPFSRDPNSTVSPDKCYKYLKLSNTNVVEVLLEVVSIRNAPPHQKGSLFVSFRKKQSDIFLSDSYRLNIQSETGVKQRVGFKCEPTGDLILSLVSKTSNLPVPWAAKTMGKTSISLQDLMNTDSELAIEKWFALELRSGTVGSKPIYLHIAVSFTVPVPAPRMFYMVRYVSFPRNTCFSSFPEKLQHTAHRYRFIDVNNNELLGVHMRCIKKKENQEESTLKQIVCLMKGSRKPHVLAELIGNVWSLIDSKLALSVEKKINKDGHIFEFISEPSIKLFPGRRLEFEPKTCKCKDQKDENYHVTVVGFSMEDPYGKSLALINLKSGFVEVNEDWFVLPGMLLAYIFSYMLEREGYSLFMPHMENIKGGAVADPEAKQTMENTSLSNPTFALEGAVAGKINDGTPVGGLANNLNSKCGGGCSGSCGAYAKRLGNGGIDSLPSHQLLDAFKSTNGVVENNANSRFGGGGSGKQLKSEGLSTLSTHDGSGITGSEPANTMSSRSGGCGGGGCGGGCGNRLESVLV